MYKYKQDEEGLVQKLKAQLYVRGDLEDASPEETYAATLAAKIFRALIAIAAAFNLEIR